MIIVFIIVAIMLSAGANWALSSMANYMSSWDHYILGCLLLIAIAYFLTMIVMLIQYQIMRTIFGYGAWQSLGLKLHFYIPLLYTMWSLYRYYTFSAENNEKWHIAFTGYLLAALVFLFFMWYSYQRYRKKPYIS